MNLSVARIENHQADKHHHVRQTIERRIQESAIAGHASGKPRDLPVEHVEKICNDQNNAGPEEQTEAEQHARGDVNGDSDDGENVWIDMTICQPAHHGIDNPLAGSSNTCSKHYLGFAPSDGH